MGNDSGATEYVYWVSPSAPAGTPVATPTSTPVLLPPFSHLWKVEVRIPAGHQGVTGLALVDSGAYIVPFASPGPAWLIGDNDLLEYPYDKEVGKSVVFLAYNTGIFPHAWQCRLTYSPLAVIDDSAQVIVAPDMAAWLAESVPGGGAVAGE